MLLLLLLYTPEVIVGYTVITAVQDYPHQDFAPLIVFIVSIEVYSDILTGGYAITTIIYSYIFCIYRYI